jgi:hypothetical protein
MDSLYLCIKSWFSNMWSSIKSNVASYKSNFRYMHFFWGMMPIFLSDELVKS